MVGKILLKHCRLRNSISVAYTISNASFCENGIAFLEAPAPKLPDNVLSGFVFAGPLD